MATSDPKALLRRLLREPRECAWLEFKHNNCDPELIGRTVSACANAAMLADRDRAFLVWGIENKTRRKLGTAVEINSLTKGSENITNLQTEFIAVAASPSCTVPGACSPAATAIGLPTRASRNRLISGGLGNPRRSECGWAEARTCLRSFPTSQEACTGGPMSDGAASMMLPKSDQPLA
jgi:hypothetical protein